MMCKGRKGELMDSPLSVQLHDYLEARSFHDQEAANHFFHSDRVFWRPKRLYFDEVENANVWSFFLVERDLHHTFEEYVIDRQLPPYAIWSKRERQDVDDGIGRATFPISETVALYRQPVPRAGDLLRYALEVRHVGRTSAVFGFLGFLIGANGECKLNPSVASLWLRVFVRYQGDENRKPEPIPDRLRKILVMDEER
jgi:hypothetical protein